MARERIYIYDTTLRDGQQTPGIDFSVEDKKSIVALLEELGVDYVEGGYPGANPTDTAFFKRRQTARAKFVAFGMTKRAGVSASNDPGLSSLLQASADAACWAVPMRKIWSRSPLPSRLRVWQDGKRWSIASISSTDTRPIPNMRLPVPRLPIRQVRAGLCFAIRMAARNRRKSPKLLPP